MDVTDADLLADAMVHLATTDAGDNQVGSPGAYMSGAMRNAWFGAVVPQPGRPAVLRACAHRCAVCTARGTASLSTDSPYHLIICPPGLQHLQQGLPCLHHFTWPRSIYCSTPQAFNISNGDCFRWRDTWPAIAAWFGMDTAPPVHMPLVQVGADACRGAAALSRAGNQRVGQSQPEVHSVLP